MEKMTRRSAWNFIRIIFEFIGYCSVVLIFLVPIYFSPIPLERKNVTQVFLEMSSLLREKKVVTKENGEFNIYVKDTTAWAVSKMRKEGVILILSIDQGGLLTCYGTPEKLLPINCDGKARPFNH